MRLDQKGSTPPLLSTLNKNHFLVLEETDMEEAATVMEKVEMEEGEEVKVMEQVAVEAALVMEVNESESLNMS